MAHIPKWVGRVRFRANLGFCAGRSRERTDVIIEFRTARRGVRIVLFSCAGWERFATTRSGVRSCAVPMKRKKFSEGKRAGGFPVCFSCRLCFPPTCLRGCAASVRERILWVRPEFSKICRSVGGFDFQPCPMRLQGFFCLGERRRVLDSYASLKIRTRFADRIGSSTRSPRRRSIRLRRMRQPQRTSTEQK